MGDTSPRVQDLVECWYVGRTLQSVNIPFEWSTTLRRVYIILFNIKTQSSLQSYILSVNQ